MLLSRNVDKETIGVLLQENRRLKRENQRLHESLDELQRYKDEYEELIANLRSLKSEYRRNLESFDRMGKLYAKELNKITESQIGR